MNQKNKNQGYIALMATIVISLVLLVMIVEEGSSGWYARFNILGTEAKEQASTLAEGCAEQAMANLLTNPSYTGNTDTTSPIGTCHVFPIQIDYPVPGLLTIKTQAVVNDSYANLDMAMNMNDIHFGSIPTAPSTGTLFITTHVINDTSGSKLASDFTVNVSANPNSSFSGSEAGVAKIVQPGPYSVSQINLPNYSTTATPDCSGNIIAGQIKFCTITNDDVTTTITVIANVVNDNNGTNTPADFPLFIDGNPVTLGSRVTVSAGNHTVSATTLAGYAVSPWGYDCSSSGSVSLTLGQNKTCIINYNDLPPPAPICADTVMILDRTGSMSSTDRNNEKAAANSLVSLYAGVLPPTPHPQLGVGSFGGLDGSAASVPLLGQLTTTYSNLLSSINSMMNNTSSVGSDLSAGITVASNELNSVRHIVNPPPPEIEKKKVIILVSDGDPNEPSGTTNYDTGIKSPSSNSQNATGEFWTNPTNAYSDGSGDANDIVSENDRHIFSNFNIGSGAGLPSGSTLRGIEVLADSWATSGTTNVAGNSNENPNSALAPNTWTNPTRVSNNDNSYATDSTNGHAQGFGTFGFNIPTNATITGISVSTEAKITGSGSVTTAILFPNGGGDYDEWTGGESNIDETGTVNCTSTNEFISESSSNQRESVSIDLSSVPNGATITDVNITVYDRPTGSQGGTYRTFARLNNNNTDAGTNLTATGSTSSCNVKTQTINLPDTIKNSGTNLEVGVVKVSGNSNTVAIGAIRATVTYTPVTTGSIDIALSSNNGGNWTGGKSTSLTSIETVSSPSGNSNSDLWGRSWTPTDFNNGNFALKVTNNSTTGNIVSLDQVTVNVLYTTPQPTGASCQLGVDLSWNGGTSWTSEKIQNINSTETTYTLGTPTDDWTSSHTWSITEFSNTNFRARVRAIDPGSACDTNAVEHLDWLRLKVYYSQNVDATQAALNAADAAKLANVDIFTIHFGSDVSGYNGKELLANLASGNTPVSGHQNGSFADPSGVTNGNTGLVSPTLQTATTGGDGNGFEVSPTKALSDGPSGLTGAAQNIDGAGDRHIFSGYNFSLPPNATITGIATRLDWWLDSTSGTNSTNLELSWDGGTTWTPIKQDNNESTSASNSRTLGNSTDNWGHTWTSSQLNTTNFKVRVTMNSTTSTRDFFLDWIPVTIYYTVNTENDDGDNFFIAPTSADMQDIFDFIGNQVCPASLNIPASPPPTTGILSVLTQVINNNGGTKTEADFTVNVTAVNPSLTTFTGSVTPTNVTVNPGNYSLDENGVAGYAEIKGVACSSTGSLGPIVAGETRVCVFNNDDIPPPPPPPNFNFDTNSWHEVPTSN